MRGAPRPAGRISNSRWGAFASTWPIRPSVVPPSTRAPLTSGLATKSLGFRPSGALSEATSPPSPATCTSPPWARAFLRVGFANRRTLAVGEAATGASAAGAFASAVDSCSRLKVVRRLAPVSFLAVRFLGAG